MTHFKTLEETRGDRDEVWDAFIVQQFLIWDQGKNKRTST